MSITKYAAMKEVQDLEKIQLTTEEIILLKLRIRLTPGEIAEVLGSNRTQIHRQLKRAEQKIKEQGGE